MKTIQWTATKAETQLFIKIAERAVKMARLYGSTDYNKPNCMMDIEACHCNGNPLKLAELLAADDNNFSHDVFGISKHINRTTGELMDCFSPRCSMPKNTLAGS